MNSTRGFIVAEAVMMELARHVGRQTAHDIVYEACKQTIESKEHGSLLESLSGIETVTRVITPSRLAELCEPANYLGASSIMVDSVLSS